MFTASSSSGIKTAVLFAILSGIVFAFLTPLSAVFLEDAQPVFTVAALNLGAGIGMALFLLLGRKTKLAEHSEKLTKKDTPILVCIVIGDLLGALLSMLSLTFAAADSVSLILNFELVSTALIAFGFFKEKISKRLGVAIVLITLGCIAVTAGDLEKFIASPGILLALASCICWGITHNLYRKVSYQNPHGILTIRGLGIGIIALVISLIIGEGIPAISLILIMMLIGFATYGLGNVFFVLSQRKLGAALVSAISGFSPFLAAFLSLLIFQESPTISFVVALLLLVPGVYLAVSEGVIPEHPMPLSENDTHRQTDIRNILSAIGYFIMGGAMLYLALLMLNLPLALHAGTDTLYLFNITCSAFLLIIGVILIILRKRDFIGISFIVYAVLLSTIATLHENTFLMITLGGLMLVIGILFLLAREQKKYPIAIIFMLEGLAIILSQLIPGPWSVAVTFICSVLLFLTGILSTGLLPKIPLAEILTADEQTEFKASGAMIGYLVFALTIVPWIGLYITGSTMVDTEAFITLTLISAGILALIGILLIFVGKSRFTGAIFLGLSFVQILALIGSGVIYFVVSILLIIFGLLFVLRKPSYLLPGLMFIIYGISAVSSLGVSGSIQMQFVQLLLNLISCLIAVYLAAAVFSQKKRLPLF